jgi:hypothetical protein
MRWVAAAIAIAVALFIIIRSARHSAEIKDPLREQCAAQLTRLGKALQMYALDNGGRFPVLETSSDPERVLAPLLKPYGVKLDDFFCPARPEVAYLYHCYQKRGPEPLPRWVQDKHLVTLKSPKGTWLLSDFVERDAPGPHSKTEKAFNFLTVDNEVRYFEGHPRDVYK